MALIKNIRSGSLNEIDILGDLDVSGSGRFTNGLTVSSSLTLQNILTLTPVDIKPVNPPTGSIIMSASAYAPGPGAFRILFWDGTFWNTLAVEA